MARTIDNTSIRDWSINYLLILQETIRRFNAWWIVRKLVKSKNYLKIHFTMVTKLASFIRLAVVMWASDRKRSEIRGSCAQGRLDQSRCDGLARTPSKPVRFVARFLRAHLPESHSRGAPAPPAPPSPSTRDCQLTRQMTHALAG